jgi:hypothetical protein
MFCYCALVVFVRFGYADNNGKGIIQTCVLPRTVTVAG